MRIRRIGAAHYSKTTKYSTHHISSIYVNNCQEDERSKRTERDTIYDDEHTDATQNYNLPGRFRRSLKPKSVRLVFGHSNVKLTTLLFQAQK